MTEPKKYRLSREKEAALIEALLPFADEAFGEEAIDQALTLFLDNEEAVQYEAEDPLNPLFLPWFVFNWYIGDEDEKTDEDAPVNTTVAEAYMKARKAQLSPETLRILQAANRRPLSLYEIVETKPGKSLKLRDLMLQKDLDVEEETASTSLKRGEIIIASMLAPEEGRVRPLSMGPFALPSFHKQEILELRTEIAKTLGKKELNEDILLDQEAFVIGIYLDILDEMLDEDEAQKPRL